MAEAKKIVQVRNMKKYFPIHAGSFKKTVGHVRAVDGVDLYIKEGETFGLVGESGCGKTTLGRCILRAIEPTDGETYFTKDGQDIQINALEYKELRELRKDMQLIFQDPYSSLNPRMTVLGIVSEPLICYKMLSRGKIRARVSELIDMVGLEGRYLERYPHAFSGGQRQRIGIARALATNPRFLVCDEAVSALDVSVQAQILNLLQDLQQKLGLSYLFISHDLSVIQHISHRVGVMYVGKMVETSETDNLFDKPLHPYTEALLSAKPIADPRIKSKHIILEGEVANAANPPSGCYFHPRCKYCQEICKTQEPEFREIENERFVACHFAGELNLAGVYVK